MINDYGFPYSEEYLSSTESQEIDLLINEYNMICDQSSYVGLEAEQQKANIFKRIWNWIVKQWNKILNFFRGNKTNNDSKMLDNVVIQYSKKEKSPRPKNAVMRVINPKGIHNYAELHKEMISMIIRCINGKETFEKTEKEFNTFSPLTSAEHLHKKLNPKPLTRDELEARGITNGLNQFINTVEEVIKIPDNAKPDFELDTLKRDIAQIKKMFYLYHSVYSENIIDKNEFIRILKLKTEEQPQHVKRCIEMINSYLSERGKIFKVIQDHILNNNLYIAYAADGTESLNIFSL